MKKVISLIAMEAIASLFATGCSAPAPEEGDTSKTPGTSTEKTDTNAAGAPPVEGGTTGSPAAK